ncbi:MAG: 50S ribosomal protein L4 [Verrucomicrobia bacterium]|jgi:large subunit ribosomal protein L4|nr:50S ribosomal protein L4 [Verrucomicrobiota bacterium]
MSATVLTAAAAAKAKIELISDEAKGNQAVHDVVVALQAARRSGTACTKTKGDVALSGRKPWRQKGTGRARAGYFSSPVWVGGGVAHGPKPRDYSKNVPRAVKKLAFRKALSARIALGDVLLVDSFAVAEPKTKKFVALLKSTSPDSRKTLVVSEGFDETTFKAARNVPAAQLARAADVNTEHLLAFDKIILTRGALEKISERLAP